MNPRARSLAWVLAVALALVGCISQPQPPTQPASNVTTDDAHSRAVEASFSGTALGTPAQPFRAEHPLVVPQGAVGVNATLTWSDPVARLVLDLVDPDGEVAARGYNEAQGRSVAVTVDPPRSGEWKLRVSSPIAVNAAYSLKGAAELIVPDDNTVRQTTRLSGFNEVNVIMEEGASFSFSFTASEPIHWDVHSHPEGGVKYWMEGMDASKSANFTAPTRGIYSLLFSHDSPVAADLTFEMTGKFRLHSHAQ